MKQKQEQDQYLSQEKRSYKQQWDSIAPAETVDHLNYANSAHKNNMLDQMNSHEQ